MGTSGEVVDVDSLERGLLACGNLNDFNEADDETVVYNASFAELEDNYVKYKTTQWILNSLLLILAFGIGLLMLIYIPVRRYVLRKDFRSRKLYVTPDAIVYKVTRPVCFPCLGVLKKEKHIVLPSVADIIIEQGYLQSLFGICSIRIENSGVRKPASDDVHIEGVAYPRDFRKAVLMRLLNTNEGFSQQVRLNQDPLSLGSSPPPLRIPHKRSLSHDIFPYAGEWIMQKLEEVGSSLKRVQLLIEKQAQTKDPVA